MASQINQNTIDATYPVAGQDNSSQGFRDNFQAIVTNFGYAGSEISSLQANSIIRNRDNDLGGNTTITSALYRTSREVIFNFGSVSGIQALNYTNGSYQIINLTGSTVLTFNGFSVAAGQQTRLRLEVTVSDITHTLTFPATVSLNLDTILGVTGSTLTFSSTGTFIFEISTNDGGSSFFITDLSRNRVITLPGITFGDDGSITANSLTTNTFISNANGAIYSGNVEAEWFIANVGYIGNIRTASQTFITDVGTLNSLSVSGNANVGNLTVTGITDMCGGTVYGVQFVANAANGSSTQIYSNIGAVIIAPNTTIASYTLTMPATPMDGQTIKIGFGATITTLTHTVVGGQTLLGGLTTAANTAGGEWIFYDSVWYRTT